jgi:hypothetical protein
VEPALEPKFSDDAAHLVACHFPLADAEELPAPVGVTMSPLSNEYWRDLP